MLLQLTSETLLKRTTSRCPVCREPAPAEVIRVTKGKEAKVYLKKTCAEHGESAVCIASDARFYWLAQGDPQNACCGGTACCASDEGQPGTLGRNAAGGTFEKLSTCLALIEIVNSCNLSCPTCFADSPTGASGPKLDAIPVPDLQRRIDGVIARKGPIEILQLSGGEPTLHPDFFELLAWTQAHPDIGYVLLNTNGLRIAMDEEFARRLGETFVERRFQLYLQFDGPQEAGQRALRGADLRAIRDRAIRRCEAMGLPVTLAMTVTPENLPHVWDSIEYSLRFSNVRGVAFQPEFLSGRTSAVAATRLNTADVILAAVGQAEGKLRFEDFTAAPLRRSQLRDHRLPAENSRRRPLGERFHRFHRHAGFPPGQDQLLPQRSLPVRLREPAAGRAAAQVRAQGIRHLPPFHQALHGCLDVGPGPDRPLLHPRHPARRPARFLLPLLFRVRDRMKWSPYPLLMLAGIIVSGIFWSRLARKDERLIFIYACALGGAFAGAKLAYLASEGWLCFGKPGMWLALATGKSIVGALLGGYAMVELAKKLSGYREATGDWFATIVPLSVAIGRVGCLLHGCCMGIECPPAWYTMRDRLGVTRWPAVPVEMGFNLLCAAAFYALRRKRVLPGQHFHLYLMAYGLFRFAHEYLRDTPRIVAGLTGYQIAAAGCFVLGLVGYMRRANATERGKMGIDECRSMIDDF